MKKLAAIVLTLAMVLTVFAAFADTWTCPGCGKESEGNFCSWCGTKKPAEKIVCPSCGTEFDTDAGFAFCNNCGASLTAPAAPDTPVPGAVAAGSIITFGTYEQDNNAANGAEPIEWIVLEVRNGKALLISKFALDTKPYNDRNKEVTWETCSLRSWLNSDFLKSAFTDSQQGAILLTNVDNSAAQGNREFSTDGGNNTSDYVFLLSYREANQYFPTEDDRVCAPTDYAVAGGAWQSESFRAYDRLTGIWWLRSPGSDLSWASDIFTYGRFDTIYVFADDVTVRPAIWVDLSSGLF